MAIRKIEIDYYVIVICGGVVGGRPYGVLSILSSGKSMNKVCAKGRLE